MDQFSSGLADCTGYFRVAVPETAHRYAGKKIQVFFSGVIPQPAPGPPYKSDRKPGVCAEYVLAALLLYPFEMFFHLICSVLLRISCIGEFSSKMAWGRRPSAMWIFEAPGFQGIDPMNHHRIHPDVLRQDDVLKIEIKILPFRLNGMIGPKISPLL